MFLYLHAGTLSFLFDGSFTIDTVMLVDMILAFLFLLVIFWIQAKISLFMQSKAMNKHQEPLKPILEAVLVVGTNLALLTILFLLPLMLLFPETKLPPGRLRIVYIITTIVALFFYYFVERVKNQKQLQSALLHAAQLQQANLQYQLQNLKNQVDPHFLFNSLNVLCAVIQQDTNRALAFVQKLAEVYRYFLDIQNKILVPLKQELELVDAYIYLLHTRFGQVIQFKLAIASDKLFLQLPPCSLQMLLENAVKHNSATKKTPLLIKLYTIENKLVVENNVQPRQEIIQSTKTGLSNIINRYRYLTIEEVTIQHTLDVFRVQLPLLTADEYEGNNHRR
ncbi:two-component system-sensor histidine kinase [Flammeovirgaceae bacterium 311]|nr:two-component system-sensor histidine kinase [Flammeovirgaceae bacterium 311]